MSTKGDVSDFLKLGAQYEIILAGLFDELTTQRKVTTELENAVRLSLNQIDFSLRRIQELESSSKDALLRVENGLSAMGEIEASIVAITQSIDNGNLVLSNLQEMINKNVSRQRLMNKFMLLYTVVSATLVIVVWLTKF